MSVHANALVQKEDCNVVRQRCFVEVRMKDDVIYGIFHFGRIFISQIFFTCDNGDVFRSKAEKKEAKMN